MKNTAPVTRLIKNPSTPHRTSALTPATGGDFHHPNIRTSNAPMHPNKSDIPMKCNASHVAQTQPWWVTSQDRSVLLSQIAKACIDSTVVFSKCIGDEPASHDCRRPNQKRSDGKPGQPSFRPGERHAGLRFQKAALHRRHQRDADCDQYQLELEQWVGRLPWRIGSEQHGS